MRPKKITPTGKECIVVSKVEQSLDPAKHFPGHIFRTHFNLNFNAHNPLLHLIHRLTEVVHSLFWIKDYKKLNEDKFAQQL